jgi:hypothetical protein
VMIPLNNDFIDSVDEKTKRIMVTLPDGLISVYL